MSTPAEQTPLAPLPTPREMQGPSSGSADGSLKDQRGSLVDRLLIGQQARQWQPQPRCSG
eukprot:11559183-Alexandrium_andersonii.AAC.1